MKWRFNALKTSLVWLSWAYPSPRFDVRLVGQRKTGRLAAASGGNGLAL
jgi:hypothetical protein